MDHEDVEHNNLVERYVLGRLRTEEQVRFEAHFADCDECQEQLEAAQEADSALRLAVARDTATAARAGFVAALLSWLRGPGGVVVATAALVLAVSPVLWLYGERHRLEGELAALRRPLAGVPTLELGTSRDGGPGDAIPVLSVPADQSWVTLALEPGGDLASYAAVLEDAAGRALWRGDGLKPTPMGWLLLSFPAAMLPAGEYRLRLEGFEASGRGEEMGESRFRVDRAAAR